MAAGEHGAPEADPGRRHCGEPYRAADSARSLERKLREVQDMLVVKMREVTTAREQNIPLKAEIEALKALLEEEERR